MGRETERLREHNIRLQRAVAVLQHTNDVLLLKLGIRCRAHFSELPHEILLMIFCYALPPRWLLSGSGLQSMATYPNDILSVDLRMKHSLLSVCKSWNQVGTELLYESVALRRILQLPVFVRALDGRQGLAALVKRLDMNCFVPQGYYQLHDTESEADPSPLPESLPLGILPAIPAAGDTLHPSGAELLDHFAGV
ncbi:hypothetical protein B0H14DRAFT_1607467 [Mycena olivaceomarginata]|nr:hypothetical protein B0H14DRAFT_1607467 [Mycena olivaceomarginata]